MSEIRTVGELRKELADYPDDMPVWLGETTIQGGLDYYSRPSKYSIEIMEDTQTFGCAFPPDKRRTETGLIIY